MFNRETSHFQGREPILEGLLSNFRFNKVAKYIPPNSNVLDLGCGYNGYLLEKIKDRIAGGVGIDLFVSEKFSDPKIKLISGE